MRLRLAAALLLILCTAPPVHAASVVLAWDASRDPKVVGYRIHYGLESRKYTQTIRVKGRLTTKAVIENLEEGKIYYFAVTACDANGKESAYSSEISNAPGAAATAGESSGEAPRPKIPSSKKVTTTPEGKIGPTRQH